jgi:hypothetical protein
MGIENGHVHPAQMMMMMMILLLRELWGENMCRYHRL